GFQGEGLVDEHVLNEGRMQRRRARSGGIHHHTGAVFVIRAEIAVDEVGQYQRHDCTARQGPVDLQAAVVDQPLGGVRVYSAWHCAESPSGSSPASSEPCPRWCAAKQSSGQSRTRSNHEAIADQTSVASSLICAGDRPDTTIVVTPTASHAATCLRTESMSPTIAASSTSSSGMTLAASSLRSLRNSS